MNRFKNILLVCDNQSLHDEAIGRAMSLAMANGARITLVDVVDAAPGELARMFGAFSGMRSHDVEHEVVEFHRTRLLELGTTFRAKGIATAELVLQGVPFLEIIKAVLRDGHDLVIKGVGGTAEARSLFFASTDLHLLRKCPCPVWMMKSNPRRQYARVLAAVDPDPEDPVRDALNKLIMDLATSVSDQDQSELHVCNAWSLHGEEMLRHGAFAKIPSEKVDKLSRGERKKAKGLLIDLLLQYPDVDRQRQVHLVKGPARQVIPAFARRKRVELVVMGTVGRVGIRGLFIGNTAEAILNQVECSVLAVKPPGFETPVRLESATGAEDSSARQT
ncbi:MAG: universal stress protein [Sphingomonadales bacterium]|nr:universal stress protein [Sphingomonadales bacterium]